MKPNLLRLNESREGLSCLGGGQKNMAGSLATSGATKERTGAMTCVYVYEMHIGALSYAPDMSD